MAPWGIRRLLLGCWLAAVAEAQTLTRDFEDRTLQGFSDFGGTYRRAMPAPYYMWPGLAPPTPGSGGELLLHTGSDSGVRLRRGDQRMGELRSEKFGLATGTISWISTGAGGWIAVCPVATGWSDNCVKRRQTRRSTVMAADLFDQTELNPLLGQLVQIVIKDVRDDGWGFIAVDNIVYTHNGTTVARLLEGHEQGSGNATESPGRANLTAESVEPPVSWPVAAESADPQGRANATAESAEPPGPWPVAADSVASPGLADVGAQSIEPPVSWHVVGESTESPRPWRSVGEEGGADWTDAPGKPEDNDHGNPADPDSWQ